jgi:hypothetical protein
MLVVSGFNDEMREVRPGLLLGELLAAAEDNLQPAEYSDQCNTLSKARYALLLLPTGLTLLAKQACTTLWFHGGC